MGNRKLLQGMILGCAVMGVRLEAKTIYFGGPLETVPIAAGTQTILRFEEPVKTISNASGFTIKPVSEEKPDYAVLSVEPKILGGKVETSFILAGGDIARLRLSIVPRDSKLKVEPIYDIKSQRTLLESRADALPHVGRLELMTAMIRGDQVNGYELSTPGIELPRETDAPKVTLARVYTGDEFKGYVYELQNASKTKTFNIDIRKMQFGHPNQALLAFSDLDVIEVSGSGKNKTRLVVVTKPASRFREAVLPIRIVTKSSKIQSGGSDE